MQWGGGSASSRLGQQAVGLIRKPGDRPASCRPGKEIKSRHVGSGWVMVLIPVSKKNSPHLPFPGFWSSFQNVSGSEFSGAIAKEMGSERYWSCSQFMFFFKRSKRRIWLQFRVFEAPELKKELQERDRLYNHDLF